MPESLYTYNLFNDALNMFLKAYNEQAIARIHNQEENVAHMETCKCFVQVDFLLASVSMMFRKTIANRDFLGFWDDNNKLVGDLLQMRSIYMHMTFVILCDITVRYWDDHVLEDMMLYKSYVAPTSRSDRPRSNKLCLRAFNDHYYKVFSWINGNADVSMYDQQEHIGTSALKCLELIKKCLVESDPSNESVDRVSTLTC